MKIHRVGVVAVMMAVALVFAPHLTAQDAGLPKELLGVWKPDLDATVKARAADLEELSDGEREQLESFRMEFSKDGTFHMKMTDRTIAGDWECEPKEGTDDVYAVTLVPEMQNEGADESATMRGEITVLGKDSIKVVPQNSSPVVLVRVKDDAKKSDDQFYPVSIQEGAAQKKAASDSKLVGAWSGNKDATSKALKKSGAEEQEVEMILELVEGINVEFKSDGSFAVTMQAFGEEQTFGGTWEVAEKHDDGSISINTVADEKQGGEEKAFKITFEGNDTIYMQDGDEPPIGLKRKKDDKKGGSDD